MIPFPLPPALAYLHELLEGYTEQHDRGFFLAEQDQNHKAGDQPVLMYLSAAEINESSSAEAKATERRPPTWMGEVVLADQEADPERLARYARAGVFEFWRVKAEADGYAIEIHTEPSGEAYGRVVTFRGTELLKSGVFTELELSASQLPV